MDILTVESVRRFCVGVDRLFIVKDGVINYGSINVMIVGDGDGDCMSGWIGAGLLTTVGSVLLLGVGEFIIVFSDDNPLLLLLLTTCCYCCEVLLTVVPTNNINHLNNIINQTQHICH